MLILLPCCHQVLVVITSLTSSNFTFSFSLVRINDDDQSKDDVNISTNQSEDVIPDVMQIEKITEKCQLRKKESFESQVTE